MWCLKVLWFYKLKMAKNTFFLFGFLSVCFTVFSQEIRFSNLLDIFNIVNHRQLDTPSFPQLPIRVNEDEVKFFLYTNNDFNEGTEITEANLKIVDNSKPVKYIVHGWTENANRKWYKDMTRSYLLKEDFNIIQVDWSVPASAQYPISAKNTRLVGELIGKQIAKLNLEYSIPLKNFHILGHSLGAHVSGFAGKEVIKITSNKIARITGLDPAGPLFEGPLIPKTNRLSSEDAEMVDVVHTDGGIFGYKEPLGTIDFYPNGGNPMQPGCNLSDLVGLLGGSLEGVFCSHTRSYGYFIESINSNYFVAKECDSYDGYERGRCSKNKEVLFGDSTPSNVTGIFYFKTNSQPPYAKNFSLF